VFSIKSDGKFLNSENNTQPQDAEVSARGANRRAKWSTSGSSHCLQREVENGRRG